jgi:glycine/D-amino acid oxidase-like deaminating enzyme
VLARRVDGVTAGPGDLVGFWQADLGPPPARPPLTRDGDADVCIVGAGYTGLWTAWALAEADPQLRITVVEAEYAGFGASGRNGGWLSALLPGNRDLLARGPAGPAGVVAMQRHLIAAVGEVLKICADEGIDADACHGGTLAVAVNPVQLARLRAELAEDRQWGLGPEDEWELSAREVETRLSIAAAAGGVYSPHCARIQPAKLVRGLADAVSRRGVRIYEHTPALTVTPGLVRTSHGTVRAPWVVRATEGFTARLRGLRRDLLPMNSSIIVTEPLPPSSWDRLGWAGMETLRDAAHVYIYAQRTANGRIAIGGRGVPYRFGSRLDAGGDIPPATVAELRASLRRLLPAAGEVGVAAGWSGVLGVARDWCPSVGVARDDSGAGGLAWAGGYAGDGVTTSYLAGRTLADLILGQETSRTALPWVDHRSRRWEPEPLRWAGVHAVYAMYRAADRVEGRGVGRGTRPARWAQLADRVSGRGS